MAKVVVLKQEPPPDALSARRAELMAEAQRLGRIAETRAQIERRLAELDGEQAALDEAERAKWREWAENDAEGSPPIAQTAARESIDQRRALIANDLSGVLAGEKAVAPRLQALHAELHALGLKLYERQVDWLLAEAEAINASVHEAAQAFVVAATQADGLRDSIAAALETAVTGGDRGREATLREAFSRIEQLKQPKMTGDPEARSRHAADYRRRLL
jgi:hypothetical protein